MAFPILPALIGGGLLAGQNFFANNAQASNPLIDRVLGINRAARERRAQTEALIPILANTLPEDQRQPGNPLFDSLLTASATNDTSLLSKFIDLRAQQQKDQSDRLYEQKKTDEQRAAEYARGDFTRLQDDYQADLNSFANLQQGWDALYNSLQSDSPTAAVAATFQIMKVLDPTSTVRTEEGKQVVAAEGPMSALANQLNKLIGQGWNETTRREWYNTMRGAYAPRAQNAQTRIQWYESEAERIKADPQRIIGRLGIDRTRLGDGIRQFPGSQSNDVQVPMRRQGIPKVKAKDLTVIGEF